MISRKRSSSPPTFGCSCQKSFTSDLDLLHTTSHFFFPLFLHSLSISKPKTYGDMLAISPARCDQQRFLVIRCVQHSSCTKQVSHASAAVTRDLFVFSCCRFFSHNLSCVRVTLHSFSSFFFLKTLFVCLQSGTPTLPSLYSFQLDEPTAL